MPRARPGSTAVPRISLTSDLGKALRAIGTAQHNVPWSWSWVFERLSVAGVNVYKEGGRRAAALRLVVDEQGVELTHSQWWRKARRLTARGLVAAKVSTFTRAWYIDLGVVDRELDRLRHLGAVMPEAVALLCWPPSAPDYETAEQLVLQACGTLYDDGVAMPIVPRQTCPLPAQQHIDNMTRELLMQHIDMAD